MIGNKVSIALQWKLLESSLFFGFTTKSPMRKTVCRLQQVLSQCLMVKWMDAWVDKWMRKYIYWSKRNRAVVSFL